MGSSCSQAVQQYAGRSRPAAAEEVVPGTQHRYETGNQEVLRRMREDGYITREQEDEARAALPNVDFQARGASFRAPHFVQYVQKILEERYGERVVEQGGLKVTTTLDLKLQDKAQEIVSEEIAKVEGQHIQMEV